MAVKRNLKALRRLREIFVPVPDDRVHMAVIADNVGCGTVHCLLGWGIEDDELRSAGLRAAFFGSDGVSGAADFFGIDNADAEALFAWNPPPKLSRALRRNPHAITKAAVLRKLDRVITGKPVSHYVVKGA